MRLLVTGGGFVNKGAEAMLLTVRAELGRRLPGAEFWLDEEELAPGTLPLAQQAGFPHRRFTLSGIGPKLSTLLRRPPFSLGALSRIERERLRLYRAAAIADQMDGMIDISGFRYSDSWGYDSARSAVPLAEEFAHRGKPVVYMPQAWGPFSKPGVAQSVRRIATLATHLWSRDRQSTGYLTGFGFKPHESPDLALLFASPASEERLAALGAAGIPNGPEPLIAISPNMRVYERAKGVGSGNDYVRVLVAGARQCLAEGARVLLLPHEIKAVADRSPDDRLLCDLIRLALAPSDRVHALMEPSTAPVIKALIGSCGMLIGSRFHAIVAALSQSIPPIAVGWSHKYEELLADFQCGSLLFDTDKGPDAFAAEVAEHWRNRETWRGRIAGELPRQQQKVATMFDEVAGLFRR